MEFRQAARSRLADNKHHAPPDYGPILPPGLRPAACAWQRRMADAGYVLFSLSDDAKSFWLQECAAAGVPPVLNMVGLVLAANALLTFAGGSPDHQKLLAATGRGDKPGSGGHSRPRCTVAAAHLCPPEGAAHRRTVRRARSGGHRCRMPRLCPPEPERVDDRAVLAAPGARLGGGTSEVQRNIIGELVLGLPKEPRPE